MRKDDISGKRFGKLIAIKISDEKGKWLCRCDCGKEKTIYRCHLMTGKTKSCGCYNSELTKKRLTRHGDCIGGKITRLYRIWESMISRCEGKYKCKYSEKYYRNKGIKVCNRWHDYTEFKKWALENEYTDNLSIDRIDNNGNYEPSNCRWVTLKEQGRNKGNNKVIEINGEKKCLIEWCEIYHIKLYVAEFRKGGNQ